MDFEDDEDDDREYSERWMMKASYTLDGLPSQAWEAADWLRSHHGYAREVRELEELSDRLSRIHAELECKFARETTRDSFGRCPDERRDFTHSPPGALARRVWWLLWRICR